MAEIAYLGVGIFLVNNKTIFISPIDWGLGHASRCVPIIHELKKNNKVCIGVTESNAFLFDFYFPDLKKVILPSYSIRYSSVLSLWLKLLIQWPKIKRVIKREHLALQTIISEQQIDLVISDNRFGLYSEKVRSIFITHQLNLKTPFFSGIANKLNRNYIHRFNEVWVPDFEEVKSRLAGDLSNSEDIHLPVKYIGPQSALTISTTQTPQNKFDYLILLSGVEPQRTIMENQCLAVFEKANGKVVLVRGTKYAKIISSENVVVKNFAFGDELKDLVVNAQTVICRSGYSTLMDLCLLNKKKMILIPTPGQTEQEYLANYWKTNFGATVFEQKNFVKYFKIH
jgi:predicted glycosyltransferase